MVSLVGLAVAVGNVRSDRGILFLGAGDVVGLDRYALGTIVCTASAEAPGQGWLPCNGQELLAAEFPALQTEMKMATVGWTPIGE
jgi:hypothetical protein